MERLDDVRTAISAIGILATTIDEDLPELAAAIDRLTRRIEAADR